MKIACLSFCSKFPINQASVNQMIKLGYEVHTLLPQAALEHKLTHPFFNKTLENVVYHEDLQNLFKNAKIVITGTIMQSMEQINYYFKHIPPLSILIGIFNVCGDVFSLNKTQYVDNRVILSPHSSQRLEFFINKGVSIIALELIPRISRAQSMDVLSSQASLMGYLAVIEASNNINRILCSSMTAASSIAAAKVLVLGIGVAGLQAMATAKRLGAIVTGFDIRPETRDQAISVGAKFLETTPENVTQSLTNACKVSDIIIATAQIGNRLAPKLLTQTQLENMPEHSVAVDLAYFFGGNFDIQTLSQEEIFDTTYEVGLTKVIAKDLSNKLWYNASNLYAKNLINLLNNYSQGFNFKDELLEPCTLLLEGKLSLNNFKIGEDI